MASRFGIMIGNHNASPALSTRTPKAIRPPKGSREKGDSMPIRLERVRGGNTGSAIRNSSNQP
ncbi:MAG: hypothetical protein HGB29_10340 [Chlorobiaceae bacterium]|nr:hypothetical protein [Chlorobiaceae bacterium]HWR01291.1 hypothetical protein [Chlorobaculum sp.]